MPWDGAPAGTRWLSVRLFQVDTRGANDRLPALPVGSYQCAHLQRSEGHRLNERLIKATSRGGVLGDRTQGGVQCLDNARCGFMRGDDSEPQR